MKKFLLNIVVFVLLIGLIYHVQPVYLIVTEKYKKLVAGSEIYYSILKSKKKKNTKKLLLGDSVGNQMFFNKSYNDTINSLACNQSIGLPGQYFLLNNYLKAGNEVDTVYLVFAPASFNNNMNQVYTFHYFLKPFYNSEYKPLFTPALTRQVQKIPYYYLCREPYILTSNWAPDFKTTDSASYNFLSEISVEYLQKISSLKDQYHFKLFIIPTPTKLGLKWFFEKIDRSGVDRTGLVTEFKKYFKKLANVYIADANFLDALHLKEPRKFAENYKHLYIKYY